jgi:hypothetical protein
MGLASYTLEPNPDAENNKNAPAQKLTIAFSTADVVIWGWSLGALADKLRENELASVKLFPKKYGCELDPTKVVIISIEIKRIENL